MNSLVSSFNHFIHPKNVKIDINKSFKPSDEPSIKSNKDQILEDLLDYDVTVD